MERSSMASAYARVTGPVLVLVGILGIVALLAGNDGFGTEDRSFVFLLWDGTHNVVHLLLGAVAIYVGFARAPMLAPVAYARVFGVVYTGLALGGFVSGSLFGLGDALGLHLELGENIIHLALGVLGLVVGFAVPERAPAQGRPA